MNADAVDALFSLLSQVQESEFDETVIAIAAIAMGTIRDRKGNGFLKGFCEAAVAESSPRIAVQKIKTH